MKVTIEVHSNYDDFGVAFTVSSGEQAEDCFSLNDALEKARDLIELGLL